MEAAEISILSVIVLLLLALFGYVLRLGDRVARLEGTVNTLKDFLIGREKT